MGLKPRYCSLISDCLWAMLKVHMGQMETITSAPFLIAEPRILYAHSVATSGDPTDWKDPQHSILNGNSTAFAPSASKNPSKRVGLSLSSNPISSTGRRSIHP